jgi:predicted metal-dependent hydrolase
MLVATRNFTLDRTLGAIELLRQDGITGARAWLGLLWLMWVKPGMMRKIFSAWAKFFLPGFHPWNEDDRHLIAAYEASAELGTESAKKVRRAA